MKKLAGEGGTGLSLIEGLDFSVAEREVIIRMRVGSQCFSLEIVTIDHGRIVWVWSSNVANSFGYDPQRGFANQFSIELNPLEEQQQERWISKRLSEWQQSQHEWKLRPETVVVVTADHWSGIDDVHPANCLCLWAYDVTWAWISAARFDGLKLPEGIQPDDLRALYERFGAFVKRQRKLNHQILGNP